MEHLSHTESECFAYYEPHHPGSFQKALRDLEQYVESEGPFDGVIAFSHGTSLISAFLLRPTIVPSDNRVRGSTTPFQCAIFICGRVPFLDTGIQPPCQGGEQESLIDIPTAHIWGVNDIIEPGQGAALKKLCHPGKTYACEHPGGHEVPGHKDADALIESANIIRRTLAAI